ncbi:cupin domain-containing protein [uncultured Thermanaerothrix sp.]|uniref:cupin domain-containing protein n=1 Tax=uncultured Thermanaerothrix sp. TaxID=1195149 RepID=UPI00262FFF8E|nr:cupin domain-containing protein [uncultured Thermanaerothrix sp.]
MNKTYTLFEDLVSLTPTLPADSILSRTLLQHPRLKVTLFAFAAGQELSEHATPMPAVIHILEGECDLRVSGDDYTLHDGAWVFMEAHTPHALIARTDLRMLLLMLPD